MNQACTDIEAAVTALGTAYASYVAGCRSAKAAAARPQDIDNAVSSAQLDGVIAGRLCALGLAPVLGCSLAGVGTQASTWVSPWQAKVTATVP
jgi:hypothetical protein